MRLLLIRHGSAEMNTNDDARRLTKFGRSEAAHIAEWVNTLYFNHPTIWHSEKIRAQETAAIILEGTGWNSELREMPGLRPSSPVEPMVACIDAEDKDLVIVGHMPFMPAMASELITKGQVESYWNFETCAALCLERIGVGTWAVCGFTMPSQLPRP